MRKGIRSTGHTTTEKVDSIIEACRQIQPTVDTLYMGNLDIGRPSRDQWVQIIEAIPDTIQRLDFRHNVLAASSSGLTNDDIQAIYIAIGTKHLTHLSLNQVGLCSVRENFDHDPSSEEACDIISARLRVLPQLESLSLEHNHLGQLEPESRRAVFNALPPSLRTLDLCDNDLNFKCEDIELMKEVLETLPIQTLILSDDFDKILQMIPNSKTLDTLDFRRVIEDFRDVEMLNTLPKIPERIQTIYYSDDTIRGMSNEALDALDGLAPHTTKIIVTPTRAHSKSEQAHYLEAKAKERLIGTAYALSELSKFQTDTDRRRILPADLVKEVHGFFSNPNAPVDRVLKELDEDSKMKPNEQRPHHPK